MLMGFYGLCLALILVMRLAPQSPLGRTLVQQLVEEPLHRISRLERHQLIFWLMMAVLLAIGGEVIALMGGLELTTLYLIDLSIYLDAVMATYLLAVTVRGTSAWQALAGVIRPRLSRRGTARRRRIRADRTTVERGANDDDEPAPVRLAA